MQGVTTKPRTSGATPMAGARTGEQEQAARAKRVHLALGQTLRDRAIPSDWVSCRVLRGVTARGADGLHLQLVVRAGGPTLLPHLSRIESTLAANLARQDLHWRDWVIDTSWVFADSPATVQGTQAHA